MKRDLYTSLLAWKRDPKRKPLLLRGARQVGKTYLLKAFAEAEYSQHHYLNFEETPRLKSFFEGDLNPATILKNISTYLNKVIDQKSLIIFDEIQECPAALTSLKYFCEQAREYHVVAAGSLLGVKLSKAKGFPVGKVNFLHLYPCTFLEFLAAIKKENLRKYLEDIKNIEPLPLALHEQLLEQLRTYLFVGGMPEAVQAYAVSGHFQEARDVHKEILASYLLDFAKHAPPMQVMKISTVWEAIPGQLAKENKKFKFQAMGKNARSRDYEESIQWLVDAGLIYRSFNVETPRLPLASYCNKKAFKIFMLDVGLLTTLCHLMPQTLLEGHALFTEFKGALTENYVAQQLQAHHESDLYYWSSAGEAEVDFIVPVGDKIFPLEAKSGMSSKKKGLQVYKEKYKQPFVSRTSPMNLKHDGGIVNYPLYLLPRFPIEIK